MGGTVRCGLEKWSPHESQKSSVFVIPARWGTRYLLLMEPRSPIGVEGEVRGGDGFGHFL